MNAKRTLILYMICADTSFGTDCHYFLDESARREFCNQLMRKGENPDVLTLLNDGRFDEAWSLFKEISSENQDYYFCDEVEITLPALESAAPEMLAALQACDKEMGTHPAFNVSSVRVMARDAIKAATAA